MLRDTFSFAGGVICIQHIAIVTGTGVTSKGICTFLAAFPILLAFINI
jgi:hypothetical protein